MKNIYVFVLSCLIFVQSLPIEEVINKETIQHDPTIVTKSPDQKRSGTIQSFMESGIPQLIGVLIIMISGGTFFAVRRLRSKKLMRAFSQSDNIIIYNAGQVAADSGVTLIDQYSLKSDDDNRQDRRWKQGAQNMMDGPNWDQMAKIAAWGKHKREKIESPEQKDLELTNDVLKAMQMNGISGYEKKIDIVTMKGKQASVFAIHIYEEEASVNPRVISQLKEWVSAKKMLPETLVRFYKEDKSDNSSYEHEVRLDWLDA